MSTLFDDRITPLAGQLLDPHSGQPLDLSWLANIQPLQLELFIDELRSAVRRLSNSTRTIWPANPQLFARHHSDQVTYLAVCDMGNPEAQGDGVLQTLSPTVHLLAIWSGNRVCYPCMASNKTQVETTAAMWDVAHGQASMERLMTHLEAAVKILIEREAQEDAKQRATHALANSDRLTAVAAACHVLGVNFFDVVRESCQATRL